jgi:type I restriction enzyme S subunit
MRSDAVPLPELEPLSEPKVRPFSVGVRWLNDGDYRLDASFYADEAVAAQRAVKDSGFEIKPLGDPEVAKPPFWPSRFKRIYTDDPNKGFPFLQASQAFMFQPKTERWLARSKAPNPKDYFVKEGWILVTRSGVVGRCVLVSKRLARFFLSEDLIRIVSTLPAGYLYAYLSSWIGQALITKEQYGMTVTHLEPHHLARLPVPLFPAEHQHAIHEQIMSAYRLRDEANDLLDQADDLLHKELGLPRFDESQVPYIKGRGQSEGRKLKAFAIRASELAERLDVSFHLPVAKTCVEQMQKGKYPLVRLSKLATRIFIPPRFKRIYVNPEYGVPFLRPSDIPMMKPYDLKYLSRRATESIDQLMLRVGDIMVTTDGTVGRIGVVPKQLDGWAGSNNIGRITYSPDDNRNGYVAAFLMTPYGYYQLTREIYGGVVDHLEEEHIAAVWLPDAPPDVQERIGLPVVQAFEKKEEANIVENQAIARLENILTGRQH